MGRRPRCPVGVRGVGLFVMGDSSYGFSNATRAWSAATTGVVGPVSDVSNRSTNRRH